ncbi:MAG: endonuclease III [Bacteroidota bacterium]|nr:endonuclease III [Bacteroidota bacterium]
MPSKESFVELKFRIKKIIGVLQKEYPLHGTALTHDSPLELLVATILSAQCTDERVNKVTPQLFKKYKTVKQFAEANITELESIIKSTGFYRAKAKSIINCCRVLIKNYNGNIPKDIIELIKLPGIGRKTANVVLGSAFGIVSGIVVDTHVKRLSERLGFSAQTNPENIEVDLMNIVPQKYWIDFGNYLIWHGRKTCQARKPKCLECCINGFCFSKSKIIK